MNDPNQVTQGILHSTQTTQQEQQTEADTLNPPNPEDFYERATYNDRETSSKSRWQVLKENAAQRINRLKERYPETAETLRLSKQYAREKGDERLSKAAARQGAGSAIPTWGNAAMGAYDAWDTYKDLKAFIAHAKAHPDLKPSTVAKQTKPYHEVVKQQRATQADKLEETLWREADYRHGDRRYVELTEAFQHQDGTLVSTTADKIRRQGDKIRHAEPTLEEKLSKAASNHPQAMSEFHYKSAQWAQNYERKGMKGNARERYHQSFQQVEQELGRGYLNPETNPKGVLAFERFSHENLQGRGYSIDDANKACAYGVACEILTKDKEQHFENIRTKHPEEYNKIKILDDGKDVTARHSAWLEVDDHISRNISQDLKTIRENHSDRIQEISEIDR